MRRILVVDDDPHICLVIRAWLKRYGFKVAIADGGATISRSSAPTGARPSVHFEKDESVIRFSCCDMQFV